MVSTKIKEVINNIKQEQNEKGLNDVERLKDWEERFAIQGEKNERLKEKIWSYTGLSKNDLILKRISKKWRVAKKIEESGEQIDLSNITIEEMLSDFGLMATLLEDNVLENMEEISQLSVKLNNLTGEKNAKVAENHEIAKLLQENKRLKEENKQIKEEKGQLIAQQELIKK